MNKPDYAEFDNPQLAKIYDSFNFLTEDEAFWLRMVKKLSVESIIDFGCGTGLLTCKLAKLGYKTTGIEPAKPMLEIAKKKPDAQSVGWLHGSYEQLTTSNADLIIATSHVAQFFLDDTKWKEALKSMHAALKPGGYLLFDSKNSLLKPWSKWSKELSSKTCQTPEGRVESWVELKKNEGNRTQYEIHYLFLDTLKELVSKNELIYRSESELIKNLEDAGFKIDTLYGNWDGSNFNPESSPELIFLAQK